MGYRHNPFLEEEIIETAKTFLKKPFFSSWSSFIPRAALTSERVFEMFAPRIYLTAQSDEVRNRFWDGQGNYIREITLASINSFSGYGRLAAFGLFLPESVYMEIRRYLEEP